MCALRAQGPVVSALLDSSVIRIGEQVRLDLQVTYRVDQGERPVIAWPAIGDTLTGAVEVLMDTGIDTLLENPDRDPYRFVQHRTLVITAWDSGFWAIPPFRFLVGRDTLDTEALLLEVRTVPVDTSQAYRDIKEIDAMPWDTRSWLEQHWPWIAGGAVLLAALLLLLRRLRRRKPAPAAAEEAPPLPLLERTLAALDDLERRRLWQQGDDKAHQVELSIILRAYVEERYRVPALESTTDELVDRLRPTAMGAVHREALANLLRLADLVKFAKLRPAPAEHEQGLVSARDFVKETHAIMSNTIGDAARP